MADLILYRKRIIPDECLLLKDDRILYMDSSVIVTSWRAIHPKPSLASGFSCYYMDRGYKVSKFLRDDGTPRFWYCDIVDYHMDHEAGELTVTDLLADVIIYPSGRMKVMDLDELADALEQGLITQEQTAMCMRRLDALLSLIDRDKFDTICEYLDSRGL